MTTGSAVAVGPDRQLFAQEIVVFCRQIVLPDVAQRQFRLQASNGTKKNNGKTQMIGRYELIGLG